MRIMDTHLRRFIYLSTIIFTLAFLLHAGRLFMGLELVIGTYVVPDMLSVLVAIATALMIFMGVSYLKRG
ncbi:hypothetical protein IIB51_02065 [Patescibacteria group bacterium]|nr:hypothetical protein [Patescibacteria group bacterium]